MLLPIAVMNIQDPGEREFMIDLYRSYHPLMYAVGFKILRDKSRAEDAVGASVEKLICKVSTIMKIDRCSLRSYIVSTVKHTAINMAVRQGRESARSAYSFDDRDESDLPAGDDVEGAVLEGESVRRVADALECLEERDREILRMKYFDELSDAEIADVIGIKPASVRAVLARARKRLLRVFQERGIEP